jgi:hypothetical protein
LRAFMNSVVRVRLSFHVKGIGLALFHAR